MKNLEFDCMVPASPYLAEVMSLISGTRSLTAHRDPTNRSVPVGSKPIEEEVR